MNKHEIERCRKAITGLSVKDAKNMPHAVDLSRWKDAGLYRIDADKGVFVFTGDDKGSQHE